MKKLIIFLSFWIGFMQVVRCEVDISYEPSDWPQHTLKFSSEGTLKDVFDAGLRPYRYPSLENSSLGFKHLRITMELKTGKRLPEIVAERGSISPLSGGLLSDFEMTSPNLSVDEAESLMGKFLFLGSRNQIDLKEFLAHAASDPTDYDDPYKGKPDKFGISWEDDNGPKYAVFFKKTFDASKPVSFALNARWTTNHRTMRELSAFYKTPIPPPPGYENVSMEAPRNFGPDSAVEIARSKGLPITGDRTPEEYEKQWREANDKTRAPKPKTPALEPNPKSPDNSEIWIWLIALIGIITATLLVWRWKSKPTS
jgi:hypothetical protein